MGGHVELECATQDQGDWMTVWKNGTRVISVGSLQVKMKKNVLDFRVSATSGVIDQCTVQAEADKSRPQR